MKLNPPINRAVKWDEASSTVFYIGEAPVGSPTSRAIWRIKRMTLTGNNFDIDWADGNDDFDNIWDNRASLTYG